MLKITVLVDDSAFGSRGLLAEHGFSILVYYKGNLVLLDTGQTGMPLLLNAQQLGADLARLTTVVLSHGHYDHTGGIYALTRVLKTKLLLVAHPLALKPAVKLEEGSRRYIGIPYSQSFLEEHFSLRLEKGVLEVSPGVFFLGEIPRHYPELTSHLPDTYELEGGRLAPHTFTDDTALAVDLGEELLVATGCGHSGLVNVALHAERVLGKPVTAVLGGFHLAGKPLDYLRVVEEKLREVGVVRVYPGHCIGRVAAARLLEAFQGEELRVGFTLEVDH